MTIVGPTGIRRRVARLFTGSLPRFSSFIAGANRNCAAFLLPNLLEGFGMPALAAPLMGALPVLSRYAAFHEVTGDGAMFVDAGDPLTIAAGLRQALAMSPAAKRRRLESIRPHAAHFNFQRFINDWRDAFDAWADDAPEDALPVELDDAPNLRVATGS